MTLLSFAKLHADNATVMALAYRVVHSTATPAQHRHDGTAERMRRVIIFGHNKLTRDVNMEPNPIGLDN